LRQKALKTLKKLGGMGVAIWWNGRLKRYGGGGGGVT